MLLVWSRRLGRSLGPQYAGFGEGQQHANSNAMLLGEMGVRLELLCGGLAGAILYPPVWGHVLLSTCS